MQCIQKIEGKDHAEVWGARHRKTGTLVCVKKIHKELLKEKSKVFKQLQANEIEMLERVDHPSMARVLQLLDTKQFFYIVSEFVSGGTV